MNLIQETKFILQGGNPKDLKPYRNGKLKESVLTFLADNQIPY